MYQVIHINSMCAISYAMMFSKPVQEMWTETISHREAQQVMGLAKQRTSLWRVVERESATRTESTAFQGSTEYEGMTGSSNIDHSTHKCSATLGQALFDYAWHTSVSQTGKEPQCWTRTEPIFSRG